ncbi:hypothetical protein ACUZ97_08460 [Klebsiella pneumoniae]|nr:hypothetical protein [Klebsiella pneumoniae subsp. pneumoniae]
MKEVPFTFTLAKEYFQISFPPSVYETASGDPNVFLTSALVVLPSCNFDCTLVSVSLLSCWFPEEAQPVSSLVIRLMDFT